MIHISSVGVSYKSLSPFFQAIFMIIFGIFRVAALAGFFPGNLASVFFTFTIPLAVA